MVELRRRDVVAHFQTIFPRRAADFHAQDRPFRARADVQRVVQENKGKSGDPYDPSIDCKWPRRDEPNHEVLQMKVRLERRCLAKLVVVWGCWMGAVSAYTDPDELDRLLILRDSLRNKYSAGWDYAMSTWTCPGEPDHQGPPGDLVIQWDGQIGQACDPCGSELDSWGNWAELACFGNTGAPPGFVTNIHITDLITGIQGGPQTEIPPEFCLLSELRELDLDGNHLLGKIPNWIPSCFPYLDELDLSYNKLSGPIPSWMDQLPYAEEFKLEHNLLNGRIPEGFSKMDSIRVIRLEHNELAGRLPDDFNGFEIEALWLHENPNLCGPMEAVQASSCKFSECGINTKNTRIGMECPADAPQQAEMTPVEELVPCTFTTKYGRPMTMNLPSGACPILQNVYI